MTLLALDIGSTHLKAGLFNLDGQAVRLASRAASIQYSPKGYSYYDPEDLWEVMCQLVAEVLSAGSSGELAALGITSMAETGLLLDASTGKAITPLLPWFETASQPYAEQLVKAADPLERFRHTGIRPTFKCSLAKILWLRDQGINIKGQSIWLSAADYIAYRLTGAFGSDYSLASRTCAFDLTTRNWDAAWLAKFGLDQKLFPNLRGGGLPLGETTGDIAGVPRGLPVAVCGHDHVCASLAGGVISPGQVFDSMGTAEALLGPLPERPLSVEDYNSGLMFGCHVLPGMLYWMGGLSASGGSIEWLCSLLGDPALTYSDLEALLNTVPAAPTGILYFPYLLGSGSPHTDPSARAAFFGLSAGHTRGQVAKAVLEGISLEAEFIRRAGQAVTGQALNHMSAAGGGVRNRTWMQLKADISGCSYETPAMSEATLLGAALAAGLGSGVYTNTQQLKQIVSAQPAETYQPDPQRHSAYSDLYQQGYLPLQAPLRAYAWRA